MPTLALIDYGSGNLRSVTKALQLVGAQVQRIADGPLPDDAAAVVLPGVGAFGDSVKQLRNRGLFDQVRHWIAEGRRFLGVCLGYQLLFESSEESPGVQGFGILKGTVRRFPVTGLKVPHIGWNQIHWGAETRTILPGLPEDPFVYFVHSYYPEPREASLIAATACYGVQFAAAVATKTLLATQFHPEKSQQSGLAILRQFVSSLA
jgi:imidazole glycerol-phosphate synthase subunit HisH